MTETTEQAFFITDKTPLKERIKKLEDQVASLKEDVKENHEAATVFYNDWVKEQNKNISLEALLSKAEEENKELKEKLEFKTSEEPPLYSYPTQEGEKLDTNDIHDEETLKQFLIISDSHHSPIPYNLHRITETKWVVLGLDNSIHLFDKGWEAEKFVQKAENKDRFNKSKGEEE